RHRSPTRPVTDRWAYKPVALLLLLPVIIAAAGLTAVVIAPPFVGVSIGVKELDKKLQAAGANFTRIPPIPQRSTIYANEGTTVLARVYVDNQEVALAMRVEQKYSKNKILEMYLNQVYLGNNVYGMATAAQFYFHVPASKLTLPQAALLAGMIRAPNNYDPLRHPRAALLRRNDVLNRMIGLGPTNGGVTDQRGAWAKKQPLELAKNV